jgi:hypothetical protein
VSCSIFHNDSKVYEYRPVSDKPIQHIFFAAQEDHCFFYRKGTRLASLTKVQSPARTTAYSCHKLREAFDPERGRPWCEWEPYFKLQPLATEGFRALRRPKRRRSSTDEVRQAHETMHVYTKNDDLQAIYEELLAHQQELHGSEDCFGIRRTYGADAEKVAGLRITAANLPAISIRAVPLMADDLAEIVGLAGFVYRGSSLAKFGDDLRIACFKRVEISEKDRRVVLGRQGHQCTLCGDSGPYFEFDHTVPLSAGGAEHLDNYQALCAACHLLKCEQERHTYGSSWSSRLSETGPTRRRSST